MSFPGGIPKKPTWSPEAYAAQAQSYAAPAPAPAPQPVAWWLQAPPAGQAYPTMNRSQQANAFRAQVQASQAINWTRAKAVPQQDLYPYRQQISQQTGVPIRNIHARSAPTGVYFNLTATGSQGTPQTTHFSMHPPRQGNSATGQFHIRTDTGADPRYQARSFPQMQQAAPSFGTFVSPYATNQGQYGVYPAGHPVATTYAPALAAAAGQFAQAYGTQRQGNTMNTSGGKRKSRKSTRKAKKTRRLKK